MTYPGPRYPPGGHLDDGGGAAVEAQHWPDFLEWMRDNWRPGAHLANIGPTGEGKTTTAVGLLSIRDYVMALDPKGEDRTLSASGFTRVRSLPPGGGLPLTPEWWRERWYRWTSADGRAWEGIWQSVDEGRPARVIVGGSARSTSEVQALRQLMSDAVQFTRFSRNWTLYVDEFEVAASQLMYGLGAPISQMLNTAREAGISVVTSFQAPSWVPKHATRQAWGAIVYSTGSRRMIQNIAEDMGRDWHELAEAIDELPKFYGLFIPRGRNGGPMRLFTAPKVA